MIKQHLKIILQWLGDDKHRRFTSIAIVIILNHTLGYALDADKVANVFDVVIGGLGGAWCNKSVDDGPPDAAA